MQNTLATHKRLHTKVQSFYETLSS